MITNTKHFDNKLQELRGLLSDYQEDINLMQFRKITNFSKENITDDFNYIFLSLPYEIETTSNDLSYSYYTIELFDLYYEISDYDGQIDSERIQKSKHRFKQQKLDTQDRFLVLDFVENYLHSLLYNYDVFLSNAKKFHFFVGIDDERIILENLYQLYKGVLLDKTKQIRLFLGINLTKAISDKIIEMLCDFIEQRLLVLNSSINIGAIPNKITYEENKHNKIQWLGTQQQLCELFFELIQKGWIPEIPYGSIKKTSDSITNLFDLEHTKRSKSSKPNDSFYQQFKGESEAGKWTLSFFKSKKYEKKFKNILDK